MAENEAIRNERNDTEKMLEMEHALPNLTTNITRHELPKVRGNKEDQ